MPCEAKYLKMISLQTFLRLRSSSTFWLYTRMAWMASAKKEIGVGVTSLHNKIPNLSCFLNSWLSNTEQDKVTLGTAWRDWKCVYKLESGLIISDTEYTQKLPNLLLGQVLGWSASAMHSSSLKWGSTSFLKLAGNGIISGLFPHKCDYNSHVHKEMHPSTTTVHWMATINKIQLQGSVAEWGSMTNLNSALKQLQKTVPTWTEAST